MFHGHPAVKKVCFRWITHNLTESQKDARVRWCKEIRIRCVYDRNRRRIMN